MFNLRSSGMPLTVSVLAGAMMLVAEPANAGTCIWGSFDTSRINYSAGTLTGSAHTTLQSIITGNGGTIAAPTSTLTDAYLSGVDVFYTSLLNVGTGELSAAEQTALHTWIANGGTLIVTGDIFPLNAYESFTAFYGVTNWLDLTNNTKGFPVAAHQITTGVTSYRYNTESTYTYGGDALLLGNNGLGSDFMIVMEPATGFNAGGRILVTGDHNMFTEGHIGDNDNTALATNIAQWACTDLPAECIWGSFDTSRINYSAGTLTGSAHTTLQSIITGNGGTIAAPTSTLTDAYLSGVDVFYTSLLNVGTGELSAAEQTALHTWIANGGTLIVTGDIFPLNAYESFTAFYGVTNWLDLTNNTKGFPVAAHQITTGVTSYRYNTESTYTYGGDALLLGNNGLGSDFMIVMEPATGFTAGGRILVTGDHNMFTETHIGDNDNTALATNIAQWACLSVPACPWDCGDNDGTVGIVDFLALLSEWGMVGSPCDFDGGGVGITDFLKLLAHWGACP